MDIQRALNYTKNYSLSLPLGNIETEENKPAVPTCGREKNILYAFIVLLSSTRMFCNP
jgi:hypothetical protein